MLAEEEEQPNMTDSQAFPTLPGKDIVSQPKVSSVWGNSTKSKIGVNVSDCGGVYTSVL